MDIDWSGVCAAVWRSRRALLRPVQTVDPVRLENLVGIEHQKGELLRNTERFLAGLPANSALLWGARGTGKSSLVKAVLNECCGRGLRLIEVYKDDLRDLPEIVDHIRASSYRFIFYCDDFSFEGEDASYVGLKSVLEGSIECPPENVLTWTPPVCQVSPGEQGRLQSYIRPVDGVLTPGLYGIRRRGPI